MPTFVADCRYSASPEEVAAVRPEHREYLRGLHERGDLVMSGPWADGTGACLVYRADSAEAARALLEADPFGRDGLLELVSLREWTVVVGG